MRWAESATGRIAATIFKRPLQSHIRGTTISRQGRSRASEAGHLGKFGFQRSVEASRLMIDSFASLLASGRSADGRGQALSGKSISVTNPCMVAAAFLGKTEGVCSQPSIGSSNLRQSLEQFSCIHILSPECGHGLFPDSPHLRVER